MAPVSLMRLSLLRFCYALLPFGLGMQIFPRLFSVTASAPFYEGVVDVVLAALALLSVIGLIAPVRMLPILVFEVVWKLLWFAAVLLPRGLAGDLDETIIANLLPMGLVLPFIFIIPWRRFAGDVAAHTDRWR